jgi:demethylmenaquinone methyltransferase/2-methoxy-6-polyprenyl-1,4-benzoquinol methylase
VSDKTTDFGYQQVPEDEKAKRVGGVFKSVAPSYDVMNDLMSLGLHRVWKRFTLEMSGVREGSRVLDVASGSGDLAAAFARRVGASGEVWMTDINAAMLAVGRDKLSTRECSRRWRSATPRSSRFPPIHSIASRSPSAFAT